MFASQSATEDYVTAIEFSKKIGNSGDNMEQDKSVGR